MANTSPQRAHHRAIGLACAILFLHDAILTSPRVAYAQIRGEPELLAEVAKRHLANRERIVTWRGRVETTKSSEWPGRDKAWLAGEKMSAEFAWDSKRDAKRWNCKWQDGWYQDRGAPRSPQGRDVESGMIKDGAYYLLMTNDRTKPCVVTIHPADKANDVMQNPFTQCIDPPYFLTYEGRALDKFLQFLYDNRQDARATKWNVTKKGDIVVTESDSARDDGGRVVNRLEVDLAQGANLVRFEVSDPNVNRELKWRYEQVSGIWVPK